MVVREVFPSWFTKNFTLFTIFNHPTLTYLLSLHSSDALQLGKSRSSWVTDPVMSQQPTLNSSLTFFYVDNTVVQYCIITHAHIATGAGKAFSRVCLSVCPLSNRLELSTPNLVHVYSIAVARHALTQRSIGQSHMVTKTATVTRLLVTMFRISRTNMLLC